MSMDTLTTEQLDELARLAQDADAQPYDVKYENGKAYLYGGRLHAQIADFRLIRGQANAKYVAAALNALPALLAELAATRQRDRATRELLREVAEHLPVVTPDQRARLARIDAALAGSAGQAGDSARKAGE